MTASSGLTVAISVDAASSGGTGPGSACKITGGVVSFPNKGTCILDFDQAGNATWNAATQLQQTITVN